MPIACVWVCVCVKKQIMAYPPHFIRGEVPRERRSGTPGCQSLGWVASLSLGWWWWWCVETDNASLSLSTTHARARHVDDEGTYVRTQGRISYVCLTTRRNQISLRTQRKCRHIHSYIHSFIPPLRVEDARGTQHVSDDDVRNDDATRGDGAGGVETTDGNNV